MLLIKGASRHLPGRYPITPISHILLYNCSIAVSLDKLKDVFVGTLDLPSIFAHIVWAVEVAVGDGFHVVVGEDVVAAFEVGDGAGNFEDAFHGVAQFFQFTSTDRMNSGSSMTEYS